jgi:hypothetical protein
MRRILTGNHRASLGTKKKPLAGRRDAETETVAPKAFEMLSFAVSTTAHYRRRPRCALFSAELADGISPSERLNRGLEGILTGNHRASWFGRTKTFSVVAMPE